LPGETRLSEKAALSETEQIDRAELARVAAGDRAALTALVKRHQDALFRFLRRLTPDVADAEDALQETFVSAYRHCGAYRGEGTVRSWLFTIARRTAAMRRRRHVGEPEAFESLESLGLTAGWGSESLFERIADREAVTRALEAIAADDREILALHDVEGLTGAETAAALELSLPAMKSRLHRARLRLAAALQGGMNHGA